MQITNERPFEKKDFVKRKIIGLVGAAAILVAAFFIFLWAAKTGMERQEKYECQNWQRQANEYPLFYLTDAQKKQCDEIGYKMALPIEEYGEDYVEREALVFAYTSSEDQTDEDPLTMASGKKVYYGAIACPVMLEFGTKVEIGGKVYTCEDRMAERYRKEWAFDIWMDNGSSATYHGVKKETVKIYK